MSHHYALHHPDTNPSNATVQHYQPQEHDVLHALALWVSADPSTRSTHLPTLLRAVRLHPATLCSHLASPAAHGINPASMRTLLYEAAQNLAAQTEAVHASHEDVSCADVSITAALSSCDAAVQPVQPGQRGQEEACITPSLLPQSSSPAKEGCWWASPRRAMAAQLLVAGGHDEQWRPLRMVELFGGRSGSWETRASLPSACPIAAAVAWEGRVHLVAGNAHSSTVMQYDTHTDAWRDGARMAINRVNLALAGVTDALFALVRGCCETACCTLSSSMLV